MERRALIDPRFDRVCQIIDVANEDQFAVAAPLFWTGAPDNVTDRWTYVDGVFLEPPADPVPPRLLSPRQFRLRLTEAEQTAITEAAMIDRDVLFWRLAAAEAREIDLDDPETAAGLDLLIGKGLLAADRKATLLA